MPEQYSVQEFAKKLRERRPDLGHISDEDLVNQTIKAAPELEQFVRRDPGPVSRFISSFGETSGFRHPIEAVKAVATFSVGDWMRQNQELLGQARGAYRRGDYLAATRLAANWMLNNVAPGAGTTSEQAGIQMAGGDVAGGFGTVGGYGTTMYLAPKVTEAVARTPGALRQLAREGIREPVRTTTRGALGAGPARTTLPMGEKYIAEREGAREAQIAETEKTAQRNAAEEARVKEANRIAEETSRQRQMKARQVAEQKQREGQLKYESDVEAARKAAEEETGKQRGEFERSQRHARDSESLGNDHIRVEEAIRQESNEKFQAVQDRVSGDQGVPTGQIADVVRNAMKNDIQGSTESIKQFRQILDKVADPEIRAILARGAENIEQELRGETPEALGGQEIMPYKELHGFSTELARMLRQKWLQRDVYQAVERVHNALEAAKMEIAERNGAGDLLRAANDHFRGFMEIFHDEGSAAKDVWEASVPKVGTQLDPELRAQPYTKGPAAQVTIQRMRDFAPRTRHANELGSLASSAERMRLEARASGIPARPGAPAPEPVTPKDVEPPRPVTTKVPLAPKRQEFVPETPKTIPEPTPPTVKDVETESAERIRKKAAEVSELRRFDLQILAASAIGFFLRPEATAVGLGVLGGEKFFLPRALNSQRVIDWLKRPSARELEVINRLPQITQAELWQNLGRFAKDKGISEMEVHPTIRRAIQASSGSAAAGGIRNRREALERLGQSVP